MRHCLCHFLRSITEPSPVSILMRFTSPSICSVCFMILKFVTDIILHKEDSCFKHLICMLRRCELEIVHSYCFPFVCRIIKSQELTMLYKHNPLEDCQRGSISFPPRSKLQGFRRERTTNNPSRFACEGLTELETCLIMKAEREV